jgi:thymidine phosphorylase
MKSTPALTLGTFTTGSGAPVTSPEVQRQLAAALVKIACPAAQPATAAKPA